MESAKQQRFWDERAREDAFYFVDNGLVYRRPNVDHFWAEGARQLDSMLGLLGIQVRPSDDVVDIGCGVGRLTRVLAARARSVQAVDVSSEMLTRARELNAHLENVVWVHGDGASLRGVADGAADACVSHVVFQHFPDPETTYGYVREMGRVLRPGGWAAFQVSNDPAVHRSRTSVRDRVLATLGRFPKGQDDPAWLGSAVELAALEQAAVDGGLATERVAGAGTQLCYVSLRRRA